MSVRESRHVMIRGRVQGVGFRAFVEHEARRHHLDGWVRNRRDGAVEAVFAGPPDLVALVIDACRRGPTLAHVDAIEEREATPQDMDTGRGRGFATLSTL